MSINTGMINRKKTSRKIIHNDLITIIKRLYPEAKTIPNASKMLSLDIYNGIDLIGKLKQKAIVNDTRI